MSKKDGVQLVQSRVQAGFPSPADDYMDGTLDLNEHLVSNPPATFFVKVIGDSMIEAGIFEGDLLIVDRSISPRTGNVVIAELNGEFTVKRLIMNGESATLKAENRLYKDIVVTKDQEFSIWGVVTNSIHSVL